MSKPNFTIPTKYAGQDEEEKWKRANELAAEGRAAGLIQDGGYGYTDGTWTQAEAEYREAQAAYWDSTKSLFCLPCARKGKISVSPSWTHIGPCHGCGSKGPLYKKTLKHNPECCCGDCWAEALKGAGSTE